MTDDVVVVGAGLSGLLCARRLASAGVAVTVVEARDRVGGRTLNGWLGDAVVDLGGHWLSAGQPRLIALARELGVTTYPQPRDGAAVVDLPARPRRLLGGLRSALAQRRWLQRIERMSRQLEPGWDAVSLGAWLDREVRDAGTRDRISLHAELTLAASPADLSLLSYLAHLGATGGFGQPGAELPGGGREHRFTGGAQELSLRLAAGLGDAIRLEQPIAAIDDDGARVRARGPAGEHAASRLVLAVPPAQARRIELRPALPAPVRGLVEASRPGAVVKVVVGYPRAFWRDDGCSGEAYRGVGAVRATVDVTGRDGQAPALLAFVVGAEAARWASRDPDERRAEVLATLAELFGDAAGAPSGYLEHDWASDPWSGGCVAGCGPGGLATGATWRGRFGRIHIAGTESAIAWPGYLEGAIEAGERAAAEILAV